MPCELNSIKYPFTLAHVQEFEVYTSYPRHFGMTIDVEGLQNRWDGGHCLVCETAYLFLNRTGDNVQDKVCLIRWHTLRQPG